MRPYSRLEHLLAGLRIHRGSKRGEVALLRPPFAQVQQPPPREEMSRRHHRRLRLRCLLRPRQLRGLMAVVGIDLALGVDADLGEPHAGDDGGLAPLHLQRHADAADEPVAVVGEPALAHEEALHRRVGDAPDLAGPGAVKKPKGPARHGIFSYHERVGTRSANASRVQRATASSTSVRKSERWQRSSSAQALEQSSVIVSPRRTRAASSSMRGAWARISARYRARYSSQPMGAPPLP